jgi:hypothetical protein
MEIQGWPGHNSRPSADEYSRRSVDSQKDGNCFLCKALRPAQVLGDQNMNFGPEDIRH